MKKAFMITFIIFLIIFIGYSLQRINDKINEKRCYNLPLNKFYNDKTCLKYTEDLND